MPGIYTLKVLTEFASAHTLRDYPGACARMHGHNWKVEVEVKARALDNVGMGVDFKVIKTAARDIGDRLDHRYLNEIQPFTEINPTAENIAAYFYRELVSALNNERIQVSSVTLWETDRACVRYAEEAV
ncbi:MAG: 6-carboxytetrahydropterin synthase QueD [Gammaproteobacteria bacterium]|nr:6-carboxytetrahydropterin synthase QueD [Gammaproteobacteria bacterium]MBU2479377.1 6-carboxytetrahydropterin synthase QueD [Gammaproteobacteria bacterium]